ncbi:MAG: formamidopyrimidine-DNA glycosylase [Candidatus Nealsonbacteria bacterium CG09_land_8_20_14_0_10_42_14]|uniref:Formamidopyrimidine-DNA glycosylase n=1 Tax=Candidatus Nealsonbacteria bacterium CG09_land_8_20_14_0_10_42_14 TaxID=1974707 RepID=A0A2H0WXX9_9BACT|nr:MAG: formamidopyrimidine-DNA glycosylase [Candidatus Nealsonbacteria bacterium CG09_land_8_20_14_0_10_42_14]
MPELPEVETIRRQLEKKIVGKKLNGKKITAVRRRAKVLMIDFSDGTSLVFHLKLTGQLIFNGQPLKHTRKVFKFSDGSKLVFNDVRKFGWWKIVKDTGPMEKGFGPEALTVDLKTFADGLKKHSKTRIKPLLMDQKFIAGIGNIYSDEILFAARVHPLRRVKTLKDKEIELIHQNIKKILQKAIRYRGTTEQYYRDAYGKEGNYYNLLKAYQREGEKCSRCGTIIKRVKIGGRSAHFCPKCQKS